MLEFFLKGGENRQKKTLKGYTIYVQKLEVSLTNLPVFEFESNISGAYDKTCFELDIEF